ncbi:MAG: hypothetical protein QF911_03610 [Candidatus Thalassarchaeaceae archaeon]|nr:hypothetical protein [Candidatus Thalassarchaeaceae archaeon]
MPNYSEIERFQRWLQAELADTSEIEDQISRDKRRIQIEIAIAEAIRYGEILDRFGDSVASPFVERSSPVREPSNTEIKPTSKETGECPSCGASMSNDLDFCPVCGEF